MCLDTIRITFSTYTLQFTYTLTLTLSLTLTCTPTHLFSGFLVLMRMLGSVGLLHAIEDNYGQLITLT